MSHLTCKLSRSARGAVAALLLLLDQGCAVESPEPSDTQTQPRSSALATDEVGATLPTYSLDFPSAKGSDLVERSRLLASALSREALPSAPFEPLAQESLDERDTLLPTGVAVGSRNLAISYLPALDQLGVLDERPKIENRTTSEDMGAEVARAVFGDIANELDRAGVIDLRRLAIDELDVSRTMQAEGFVGQEPAVKVTDYVFFAPLELHGARVRYGEYEAGLQVSVHRAGQVSAVKLANPLIRQISTTKRVWARADVDLRVREDFPGAEITPLGLSFSLDVQAGEKNAAPLQTYRVVPTFVVEGRTVHARVTFAFYRVDQAPTAAMIWPTPDPEASGDARPNEAIELPEGGPNETLLQR